MGDVASIIRETLLEQVVANAGVMRKGMKLSLIPNAKNPDGSPKGMPCSYIPVADGTQEVKFAKYGASTTSSMVNLEEAEMPFDSDKPSTEIPSDWTTAYYTLKRYGFHYGLDKDKIKNMAANYPPRYLADMDAMLLIHNYAAMEYAAARQIEDNTTVPYPDGQYVDGVSAKWSDPDVDPFLDEVSGLFVLLDLMLDREIYCNHLGLEWKTWRAMASNPKAKDFCYSNSLITKEQWGSQVALTLPVLKQAIETKLAGDTMQLHIFSGTFAKAAGVESFEGPPAEFSRLWTQGGMVLYATGDFTGDGQPLLGEQYFWQMAGGQNPTPDEADGGLVPKRYMQQRLAGGHLITKPFGLYACNLV